MERWAVANGDWSSTSTWNGGTLPGPTDDVYANNFIVTIDQSIDTGSLNIIAGTTAVAGGQFTTAITGTIDLVHLTLGARPSGSSQSILTITGGSVTLTVDNAITGDVGSFGSSAYDVIRLTGGTHIINAPLEAAPRGRIVRMAGAASLTINGNVHGDSSSGGVAVYASNDASITINGNVELDSGAGATLVDTRATCTVVIEGNVTGSDEWRPIYTGGYGSNYTVRGDLRCGNNPVPQDGVAIYCESNDVLRVSGNIYVLGAHPDDGAPSNSGLFPIYGAWCKIAGEDLSVHVVDDSDFPTSNAGDPVELGEGGGGGGTIPTSGVIWPPRYYG